MDIEVRKSMLQNLKFNTSLIVHINSKRRCANYKTFFSETNGDTYIIVYSSLVSLGYTVLPINTVFIEDRRVKDRRRL